jgi:hypothetical protein
MLVMVLVPVLVVMSGALAFSAFTGNITTNVNATAGYIGWSENVTGTYVYMHNTNVKTTYKNVSTPSFSEDSTVMSLGVSNLAPGNWVEFNITVKNTGSVGLELGTASVQNIKTSSANLVTHSATSMGNFTYGQMLSGNGFEYWINESPSGSLDHGASTTFNIFIGLGYSSTNLYQDASTSFNVTITASSDP